jgi:hypothetical protein
MFGNVSFVPSTVSVQYLKDDVKRGAPVLEKVQQVRHLLEVRRDVGDVAPEVRVVELQVDHVLDLAVPVAELARLGCACRGTPVGDHAGRERRRGTGGDEHGEDQCSTNELQHRFPSPSR